MPYKITPLTASDMTRGMGLDAPGAPTCLFGHFIRVYGDPTSLHAGSFAPLDSDYTQLPLYTAIVRLAKKRAMSYNPTYIFGGGGGWLPAINDDPANSLESLASLFNDAARPLGLLSE